MPSKNKLQVDQIRISPSGQVFKLRAEASLTKRAVSSLFKSILAKPTTQTKQIFLENPLNDSLCSILIFKTHPKPSFVVSSSLTETKFGYIVLIRDETYCAVFCKHCSLPTSFKEKFLVEIPPEDVIKLHANKGRTFEKVNLSNLAISDIEIRKRAFEAKDLQKSLPPLVLGRQVANSMKYSHAEGSYSISAASSRIKKYGTSLPLNRLIEHCIGLFAEFEALPAENSDLSSKFAVPSRLSDLPDTYSVPVLYFEIDSFYNDLENKVQLGHIYEREDEDADQEFWSKQDLDEFLDSLRGDFQLKEGEATKLCNELSGLEIEVKRNKLTFSVVSDLFSKIRVTQDSDSSISMQTYLLENKGFSFCFSDPEYAYIKGSLYRDQSIRSMIDNIIATFTPWSELMGVDKEKGHDKKSTAFHTDSAFGVIESKLGRMSKYLICDDLDEEWCDFLTLTQGNGPHELTFIHAKGGKTGRSCSKLHDLVSQAEKNLHQLKRPAQEYKVKLDRIWSKQYSGTKISRCMNFSDHNQFLADLERAMQNPNTSKRVVLVCTFLSHTDIVQQMENLKTGSSKTAPQISQMVWLLGSLLNCCIEFGYKLQIVVKP